MEQDKNEFYGELGEFITPYVSMVKTEGEEKHASIAMHLEGYIPDEDGGITLIFSPSEIKRLCDKLIEIAETANDDNYKLLRHKPLI